MVKLTIAFVGLAAASASAAPLLHKRIAQVIADSTAKWEQACLAAGGAQQCNPLSITAFTTLLAAAGPCEQQDAADKMMDLAKQLKSDDMIRFTQIFVQQPRNSPNSVAIPYCQTAPRNPELNGLFQCQFVGSNQNTFANGAALGAAGTIPFGLNAPLNPLGSCPANPQGPVPDGQQLVDITTNPNAPGTAGGAAPPASTTSAVVAAPPAATSVAPPAASSAAAPPAATPAAGGSDKGGFQLANGQAAQKLNAKFATLSASSSCTDGEQACVGTAFAQCVGGKFVTTSCGAAPLTCAALPLVNSAGTSITCTTTADAEARIAATGATGGLTGSGASSTPAGTDANTGSQDDASTKAPSTPAPSTGNTGSGSGFQLQNGKDAQALNAKFAKLTASSSCTEGESACVSGGFAQCVSGKFVVTQCAGGLTCVALPLVNKAGTSIACTTQADALSRIQATGATGGITGA